MTPAEVAEWLTEKATDVQGIAQQRYPSNRNDQLRDEAAQLRLLVETAAEHMHQFEREIARLNGQIEMDHACTELAATNYRKRIDELQAKIPPPLALYGALTDEQKIIRLTRRVKSLTEDRSRLRAERAKLRDQLFDKTKADAAARLADAGRKAGTHA